MYVRLNVGPCSGLMGQQRDVPVASVPKLDYQASCRKYASLGFIERALFATPLPRFQNLVTLIT